jgi:hypothetical protein
MANLTIGRGSIFAQNADFFAGIGFLCGICYNGYVVWHAPAAPCRRSSESRAGRAEKAARLTF